MAERSEIKAPPTRNIWCRRYAECLDRAIVSDENFDCSDCPSRFDQAGRNGIFDLFYDCLLLTAIFFPRAFRWFQQVQNRQMACPVDEDLAETQIVRGLIRQDREFFEQLFRKLDPGPSGPGEKRVTEKKLQGGTEHDRSIEI